MKVLIIGNGFIGGRCAGEWPDAVVSDTHIASVAQALDLLDEHKPDAVLNAAGVVGKPNVDWCETHQIETIEGNTVLPIIIAVACQKRGVYLLHIGTGCVFYGYSADPKGWKESDFPNPSAVYTKAKYAADLALSTLPNVGVARIRLPTDYISTPGNLIDKLASFPTVVDVINSVTVVSDMILIFRTLLEKKAAGLFHVTNQGAIKHREIIALYEELVDPKHRNQWVSEAELLSRGLVKKTRSNNILQSENLLKLGIKMRPIQEAMRDTMERYAQNKNNPPRELF